jgi:hypothetical protein
MPNGDMRRRLALLAMLLAVLVAAPTTQGGVSPPRHTKKQAEVNVLRVVAKRWKAWRGSGLVNPHTHLLADNTEAVCSGRGKSRGKRFRRFLCVVRPHVHHGRQGLWLRYRAMAESRCRVTVAAFRRR